MTVKVSTKGQVVIPLDLRKRAGVDAGDELEASMEAGGILLKKAGEPKRRRLRIKIDKETGFPYFDVPKDAPPITSEWVKEQLVDFP
jgi:AbrB family looped-hinge helix DNA binding protein